MNGKIVGADIIAFVTGVKGSKILDYDARRVSARLMVAGKWRECTFTYFDRRYGGPGLEIRVGTFPFDPRDALVKRQDLVDAGFGFTVRDEGPGKGVFWSTCLMKTDRKTLETWLAHAHGELEDIDFLLEEPRRPFYYLDGLEDSDEADEVVEKPWYTSIGPLH